MHRFQERAKQAAVAPPPPLPDERIVSRIRLCARRCQIAPRLDLDRLAVEARRDGDPALDWGVALIQAASRRRKLSFHIGAAQAATHTECWLARLVLALRDGDLASARFLIERHVDAGDRRLAVCFARRLADALEEADSREAA